jgi:hypothetical protein
MLSASGLTISPAGKQKALYGGLFSGFPSCALRWAVTSGSWSRLSLPRSDADQSLAFVAAFRSRRAALHQQPILREQT